jgi:hypothetical protein
MTQPESPDEKAVWCRRFASSANNRAWTLSEQSKRSAAEDQEMLHAAHAAAYLWQEVGTEHHAALARLLLGQVHALLGHAGLALAYATSAHQYFLGRDSEAWETALSHVIMANAASCAGQSVPHREHYRVAVGLIEALADAEEREILMASLRVVPLPQQTDN